MAKKRIMTIDDLYTFCLNNNFENFNGKEDIVVQMPVSFNLHKYEEVDRLTEGMTPFVAKAFHDHINLNKSEIPEDVFNENVPSSNLRPILAHIVTNSDTGEKDFGSHDFFVEVDEDGNEHYVYEEQPVGVIDGSKTTIEYDEDAKVNRAVLHGFLYDGYCQDAIDIINRRGNVSCSVELSIRKMSFNTKDRVLTLDDFFVLGLTLLSATTKPGMAGSNLKIEDFAMKNSNMAFSNEHIIKLLNELNDKLTHLSGNTKDFKEGGNTVKFEELLKKYNKTVEDIDFDYSKMSYEELEAKFAELFETETEVETEAEVETESETEVEIEVEAESTEEVPAETESEVETEVEPTEEKFVKKFEISHEDIRSGLYSLLSSFEESDNEWYWIENVYENHFIYCGCFGGKIYGQKYVKNGDNVEFAEERWELYKELLTASEKAELESMRKNYAHYEEIEQKLRKYESEPEKMAILNSEDFKNLNGIEAFEELKLEKNHFDLTVEEVKAKAEGMLLEFAKHNLLNFNQSNNSQSSILRYSKPQGKKIRRPYGNLTELIK